MKKTKSQKLDQLEKKIPLRAAKLFSGVYKKVLASGRSVVVGKDGALYRVSSSQRTKIKDIEPDVHVTGKTFKIR